MLRSTKTLVIVDMLKSRRDESMSCLSEVDGYVSIIFR